jgi:hypothetical protein
VTRIGSVSLRDLIFASLSNVELGRRTSFHPSFLEP